MKPIKLGLAALSFAACAGKEPSSFAIEGLTAHIAIGVTRYAFALDTLELAVYKQNGEAYTLSQAQRRQETELLKSSSHGFSCRLPAKGLTIAAKASLGMLRLDFLQDTNQNNAEFFWPQRLQSLPGEALVAARGEGEFMPVENAELRRFLRGQEDGLASAGLPVFSVFSAQNQTAASYIVHPPYYSSTLYSEEEGRLGFAFRHQLPQGKGNQSFSVYIAFDEQEARPIAVGRHYRRLLQKLGLFKGWPQKLAQNRQIEKLFGAPHAYVWGQRLVPPEAVANRQALYNILTGAGPAAALFRSLFALNEAGREAVKALQTEKEPSNYLTGLLSLALSAALNEEAFFNEELWLKAGLAKPAALQAGAPATERLRQAKEALVSLMPEAFVRQDVDEWGSFLPLVKEMRQAGIENFLLAFSSYTDLYSAPAGLKLAEESGFLVAPYDSYHSIHSPAQAGWETAVFTQELFENGAIERQDGSLPHGFGGRGRHLNSGVALPYVKQRVEAVMGNLETRYNAWFLDTDAAGEYFDDYSAAHLMTKAQDVANRQARARWIEESYGAVMGSEGGFALIAPAFAFGHGVMTPFMRWDAEMLRDPSSPYYTGRYYPSDAPETFFKEVDFKEEFRAAYFDARYRVPLYQSVFHDSIVATHHWSYGSLKSRHDKSIMAVLEFFYNIPPLYHLNLETWRRFKEPIAGHYRKFNRLHKKIGRQPLADFVFLNEPRTLQQIEFGDVKMIANFSVEPYQSSYGPVPARGVLVIENERQSFNFAPNWDVF